MWTQWCSKEETESARKKGRLRVYRADERKYGAGHGETDRSLELRIDHNEIGAIAEYAWSKRLGVEWVDDETTMPWGNADQVEGDWEIRATRPGPNRCLKVFESDRPYPDRKGVLAVVREHDDKSSTVEFQGWLPLGKAFRDEWLVTHENHPTWVREKSKRQWWVPLAYLEGFPDENSGTDTGKGGIEKDPGEKHQGTLWESSPRLYDPRGY